MKKYLITSAAALALCGLITSCSHDIDGLTAEESVVATYEKAFITAFGQPAPDQTWGFGPSISTSRAMTRATETEYRNSYAKSYTDYLNPSVDGKTTNQITISQMQAYTTFTDDYIRTNSTLTNAVYNGSTPIYLGDGKHFRVASDTEIREKFHVNGTYGIYNDVVIYVEGKMHLNGNTLNGPTIVVANGGEVIIDGETNMSNAGRIVVLGGGKISGTNGAIFRVNNGNPNYNAGTINYNGELNLNGSNFYNCGTVNVDLLRCTATGQFTNFGQITARTNMDAGDSYNCTIVNACHMTFTGDAGIGTLTLLNNSRLDVGGRAQFNQADQYLYANSMINVGSLYVNATKFFGPANTSDFAIIKTGRVIWVGNFLINQDNNNWKSVQWQDSYDWVNVAQPINPARGTIYVDWDNTQLYNAQGGSKYGDMEWRAIALSNFNYITEATSPVTIPASECTGAGYNTNVEPSGDEVRVIAEDLTASSSNDFDFNDVVFDVKLHPTFADKVLITLRAAGGTLPLYIGEGNEAVEVHEKFERNTGIMINTGGAAKGYANCEDGLTAEGFALTNPLVGQEGANNVKQVAKAIKVRVMKNVNGTNVECELKAEQGEATAKLCVGTDFKYTEGGKTYPCLTERTDIKGQFKYMPENNHPHKGEGKFPLYVQKIFGDDWYQSAAEPLPQSNN